MIKQLKHILVNIARLSPVDQRWILQHLSDTELKIFEQWRGLERLQEAQRFRVLNKKDAGLPLDVPSTVLPAFCLELADLPSIFTAIIIEQSSQSWAGQFLAQCDDDGAIQDALENQVLDIKPAVKHAVFKQWERSVSFERLLDDAHG